MRSFKNEWLIKQLVSIPYLKIIKLSKYILADGYGQFMENLKLISSEEKTQSSLLEVAQEMSSLITDSTENISENFTDSFSSDETLLLESFQEASISTNKLLSEFVNSQHENATTLHPRFKNLSQEFKKYLDRLTKLINILMEKLKSTSPSSDDVDAFQNLTRALDDFKSSENECVDNQKLAGDVSSKDLESKIYLERGNLSQVEVLQKFRHPEEEFVPTLDVALHRAAADGTTKDINDLVHFGADVNSSIEQNETAMHLAALSGKRENVLALLLNGADRKLKNANGDTPRDLAAANKHLAVKELLRAPGDLVLSDKDLLSSIFKYFPVTDLYSMELVCVTWRTAVSIAINAHLRNKLLLDDRGVANFLKLPKYLQYIVCKKTDELIANGSAAKLFIMLNLDEKDRAQNLDAISQDTSLQKLQVSEVGLILHFTNLLRNDHRFESHFYDVACLYSQYGALILADGLISLQELNQARFILRSLICKNGYIALKRKLVTPAVVPHIDDLNSLMSDLGLSALQRRLITESQARKIYHSGSMHGPFANLRTILTEKGLILLEKKYITPEQVVYYGGLQSLVQSNSFILFERNYISFADYPDEKIRELAHIIANINILSSDLGLSMFAEGLLNQQDLVLIENIAPLISKNGKMLLSQKRVTLKLVAKIKDLANFLSDEGVIAQKKGILTVQQAIKCSSLSILKVKNGLKALELGLITFEQAEKIRSDRTLAAILSELGMQSLAEGLLTPEHVATFYHSGSANGEHDNLASLLSPLGMQALREKLIDPFKASCYALETMFSDKMDSRILILLRFGLVSPVDFGYRGKYSCGNALTKEKIDELLDPIGLESFHKEKIPAVIKIQSHFRKIRAKQKLDLLKSTQACMKAGNIAQLEDLSKARNYIFNDKLIEAKNILSRLSFFNSQSRFEEVPLQRFIKKATQHIISGGEMLKDVNLALQKRNYEMMLWLLCQIDNPSADSLIKLLLDFTPALSVNLNKQFGDEQQTLLHLLAKQNQSERFYLFVDHGADPSQEDINKITPAELLFNNTLETKPH